MAVYSRMIKVPAPASNAFPQADSLPRLLDVLAAACHSPRLDEKSLAESFGITERQGQYYFAAASYVGLAYKRGGYIKPTPAGEAVNRIPGQAGRRAAVFGMIVGLPVFREVAIHAADFGSLPPAEDVASWVRAEDSAVNDVTAERRAGTALAWVGMIMKDAPDTIAEFAPRPAPAALAAAA